MKRVGIIGGAGFIGSYNTKKFLEEGYKVRVSAKDISKTENYEHLKNLPNAENLEIIQLDVENKAQLADFLKGCDLVVHGGTPFQLDLKDPKTEMFDPTIKGTENFLEAVQNTSGIEKVVFIASVASYNTNFPFLPPGHNEDIPFAENDTAFLSEESHPYAQAKFLANQTVNTFIADNPNLGFEITSVSPVGVMGKSLSERQDSTSTGIQFLFKNKIAPNPFVQMLFDNDVYWAIVDVADVADAIYKVSTISGIHGKNYLLSCESYKVSDMTLMLNNQPPTGGPKVFYSNEWAIKDLGIQFIPARVTLNNYAN